MLKDLEKIISEEEEEDFPWKNIGTKEFALRKINPNQDAKEYKLVFNSFCETMNNVEILQIKEIQNVDLYSSFQNSVKHCLNLKEKNGITFKDEKYFQIELSCLLMSNGVLSVLSLLLFFK